VTPLLIRVDVADLGVLSIAAAEFRELSHDV
jgi:hypothetical protein